MLALSSTIAIMCMTHSSAMRHDDMRACQQVADFMDNPDKVLQIIHVLGHARVALNARALHRIS